MISRRALAMMFAAAAAVAALGSVQSAVIPTMMFANHPSVKSFNGQRQAAAALSRQWRQQQQQQRPSLYNPWNDGSETYGYVAERHPPTAGVMDDLTAALQQQQHQQMPPVYGVPHRYFSDSAVPSSSDDIYDNPLFFAHPFNVLKRSSGASALSPAALSSYYDLLESASNVDDDVDTADDYEPQLSRQDVINFEKYVQRYFQQQQQQQQPEEDEQYSDDWTAGPSSDFSSSDDIYDVQNDEEAARQLHLLLRQPVRRPAIATREISKKSVKESTTSPTTTTSATSTTTTTSTTTQAPLTFGQPVHYQAHRQGQKEEAMLRPPTPQRQLAVSSPAPAVASNAKADASIYHTLQRMMLNHQQEQEATNEQPAEEDDDVNERAKRFVATSQESLLNQQIHSLDKIKA